MNEPTPKRSRRWFQFSLRTLMVFMVVCAVVSAWVGSKLDETRREQRVVTRIESMAGDVDYNEIRWPRSITWHFRRVRYVNLDAMRFELVFPGREIHFPVATDDDLKQLGTLARLTSLNLSGTQVTDAGLVHLHGLADLQWLYLFGTQVTDEGVARLQKALPKCRIITHVYSTGFPMIRGRRSPAYASNVIFHGHHRTESFRRIMGIIEVGMVLNSSSLARPATPRTNRRSSPPC